MRYALFETRTPLGIWIKLVLEPVRTDWRDVPIRKSCHEYVRLAIDVD